MMKPVNTWISIRQQVILNVLASIDKVHADLEKRADVGEDITYSHYMAYLAEAITREIPPGLHFLRNALDEADATQDKPVTGTRRCPSWCGCQR